MASWDEKKRQKNIRRGFVNTQKSTPDHIGTDPTRPDQASQSTANTNSQQPP